MQGGSVGIRDRGEWHNSGYLSFRYVDPAYDRRGIGDRLMRSAMVALGDQAWTLAKHGNDPAISLYGRHGMQIVRERGAETCGYQYTEIRLAGAHEPKERPGRPELRRLTTVPVERSADRHWQAAQIDSSGVLGARYQLASMTAP